jgi:TonB family protein
MSYKSLLFCPDEKTARLVTQVLSELDFAVELANETYATVKKLNAEHFDALVVDCQNEQDATLLFKTAKNSNENHTSLSVAVVEGQAGVAKAFRIGANLVLTKPINVEQSKGTLRVARGLLKKSQPKAPEAAGSVGAPPAVSAVATHAVPAAPITMSAAASASATITPTTADEPRPPEVPYSGLVVEKETLPVTEAADAAVLESLPQLPKSPMTSGLVAAAHQSEASHGFVMSSSGAAAAAAPALEKKIVEHAAGAAPLVTNEAIVKAPDAPGVFDSTAAAPSFSSLESPRTGGSSALLRVAAILAVLAIGGFFAWQKLQGSHHGAEVSATAEQQPASAPASPSQTPTEPKATAATPMTPVEKNAQPLTKTAEEEIPANSVNTKAESGANSGDIEVQEMPFSRDAKVTVTPKPQPLVVKPGSMRTQVSSAPITAPSLDVAGNPSTATIANLMPTDSPLPKPAPGTIRISQGVSQGLLLKKAAPAYPAVALQLHREGIVELLATVSKEGRISNVRVLSGDSMLAKSAVDAVRQWQYRPYLLNGQPYEVETQISVSFKLPK